MKELSGFFQYFRRLLKGRTPLIKPFSTLDNSYLYDAGTNTIFNCSDIEIAFFKKLIVRDLTTTFNEMSNEFGVAAFGAALKNVKAIITKDNILKTKAPTGFGLGHHYQLEEALDGSMTQLMLEVTTDCNLRCNYCVYRRIIDHSRLNRQTDMDLRTALAAMDFYFAHSGNKECRSVSFYGGEPLIRFDFIRSCVDYLKNRTNPNALSFSITTNGTLITPEIAEYFFKNNFSVLLSIDGPKEIHDIYREDNYGNGSFIRAMNGLRLLYEYFGEESERIGLSMVYSPPYSEEKIKKIAEMWTDKTIKRSTYASITYPAPGTINRAYTKSSDNSLLNWATWNLLNSCRTGKDYHPLVEAIYTKKLARLIQRPIYKRPLNKYYINGCCAPCARRMYIATDGNIFICEKMMNPILLGDVWSGIDIKKAKKVFIDDYEEESIKKCAKCWAINICELCYVHSFRKGQLDMARKQYYCNLERVSKERDLQLLSYINEINPAGLEYFKRIHLT